MKTDTLPLADDPSNSLQTLEPVLLPIPQTHSNRSPEQVRQQRESAREALQLCAKKVGAPQSGWNKNDQNVPQPLGNYFWSLTHKRKWCGAVIANQPVGIDIEEISPRKKFHFDALATAAEWDQIGEQNMPHFYRLWTAKEATLKANGAGIGKLLDCQLEKIEDEQWMILNFENHSWRVEHFYFDNHVVAVTCHDISVSWNVDTLI